MTIPEYNQFCKSTGLTRYYEPGETSAKLDDSDYAADYCVKSTVSPGAYHTGCHHNSYRTSVVGYSTHFKCLLLYREKSMGKCCHDLDEARKFIEDKMQELSVRIAENKKKERRARIAEL